MRDWKITRVYVIRDYEAIQSLPMRDWKFKIICHSMKAKLKIQSLPMRDWKYRQSYYQRNLSSIQSLPMRDWKR